MSAADMPQQLGRYKIVRELGKGAMGVVYEGLDPNIGRRVAIKTARRDVLDASAHADEMMERFLREARAAGALNHPNIITIYDADEQEGIAYIAMEFLEGGDLRDVIEKKRQLEPEAIVDLGAAVCDALASAHDRGVVHRDIKPANIMMPSNAPVKVADFGIAHMSDSTLTQEGALIGTPFYMSPEQFMGKKVDGRSDLFSVAVMLYELVTGEKPFTGEALSTVMHHVIRTDPVPPHELNFNIPETLSRVILKAMSKRPAERYPDGRAFAAALRESLKPNPDAALLGLASAGDNAATVVPGAPAGATVVAAPPPQGAATLQEARTVATGAPLAETVVPASAATARTMVGGPPPGIGAVPASVAVEEPGGDAKWLRPPRLYVIAGGLAVLAIVVFGLIFARGGGEAPSSGEDTPATTVTSTTTTPPAGNPPANFYKSVGVAVFVTTDWEAKAKYDELAEQDNPQAAKDYLNELVRTANAATPSPAKVTILDAKSRESVVSSTIDEGGKFVEIPVPVEQVELRILAPKHGETLETMDDVVDLDMTLETAPEPNYKRKITDYLLLL